MITKAGERLIPPKATIQCESSVSFIPGKGRTVTMNKNAPTSRKGGIYKLLGSDAIKYTSVQGNRNDMSKNLGSKRIKFCSSESCTSRTRYSKDPGKRGRTEKASFTSRMQTLYAGQETRLRDLCETFRWKDAYMCEMLSSLREARFFET